MKMLTGVDLLNEGKLSINNQMVLYVDTSKELIQCVDFILKIKRSAELNCRSSLTTKLKPFATIYLINRNNFENIG